jgi:hypothetical protein
VRVDFNSRGQDGTVRGSQRRADAPLAVGAAVELFDPAEPEMTFHATVAELDADSGRALFAVDWVPAASVRQPVARFAKVTSWGAIARSEEPAQVPGHSLMPVGATFA